MPPVVGRGPDAQQRAFDLARVLAQLLVRGEEPVGLGESVLHVVAHADMGGARDELAERERPGGLPHGPRPRQGPRRRGGLQHRPQELAARQRLAQHPRARGQRDPEPGSGLGRAAVGDRVQRRQARLDSVGVPAEPDQRRGQQLAGPGAGGGVRGGGREGAPGELGSQFGCAPPQPVGHVHECLALGRVACRG
ncbi:hypothetical protein [Actinokineospora iranica]|uniref:hypothetical protein n=1 Tax=Actinokineospora iranica TaxID=1271860 RepID=UPI001E331C46|nr:hypothetical protein [Actinokineospora iranica]